jgi:hypothetical protein
MSLTNTASPQVYVLIDANATVPSQKAELIHLPSCCQTADVQRFYRALHANPQLNIMTSTAEQSSLLRTVIHSNQLSILRCFFEDTPMSIRTQINLQDPRNHFFDRLNSRPSLQVLRYLVEEVQKLGYTPIDITADQNQLVRKVIQNDDLEMLQYLIEEAPAYQQTPINIHEQNESLMLSAFVYRCTKTLEYLMCTAPKFGTHFPDVRQFSISQLESIGPAMPKLYDMILFARENWQVLNDVNFYDFQKLYLATKETRVTRKVTQKI